MTARRFLADACFVTLSLAGFVATTLLGCLGLVPLVLLLAAGPDLEAMITHLDNFASHYLAAEPAQRLAFDRQLTLIALLVVTMALFARLPLVLGRVRETLKQRIPS